MRALLIPSAEEAVRSYRAASYNIHRCRGADGRYDPDRIVRVIRQVNADIIGLQEVDSRVPAGFGSTQLEHITMLTKYKSLIGPCIRYINGCYGNALLTRLPISDYRLIDLSVDGREPRGALDVDLVAGGFPLRVVVTHFGNRSGSERRKQARKLVEHLGDPGDTPVLVMGDFNEWFPWSSNLGYLNEKLGTAEAKPSFPSIYPVFALDRIWLRNGEKHSGLVVHSTPESKKASDHLPVVLTFRI